MESEDFETRIIIKLFSKALLERNGDHSNFAERLRGSCSEENLHLQNGLEDFANLNATILEPIAPKACRGLNHHAELNELNHLICPSSELSEKLLISYLL